MVSGHGVSTPASTVAVANATVTSVTGACIFYGYTGTSASDVKTVTVYDNTSAAGTVILHVSHASGGVDNIHFAGGIKCDNGVHVVLAGAGTHSGTVFFSQ